MGKERRFSYIYDFPTYFYYDDLISALTDLKLSTEGITQIRRALPLSHPDDLEKLPRILMRMSVDLEGRGQYQDLVWEHFLIRLKRLGFSEKAVREIDKGAKLTDPADRQQLLELLKRWLVRNEAGVPEGYPGHLRQLWKSNQLKSHERKR